MNEPILHLPMVEGQPAVFGKSRVMLLFHEYIQRQHEAMIQAATEQLEQMYSQFRGSLENDQAQAVRDQRDAVLAAMHFPAIYTPTPTPIKSPDGRTS